MSNVTFTNSSDSAHDDPEDTLKITGLPKFNEMDYLEYKYQEALKAYLAAPSYENKAAFDEANKALFEAKDAYRIGKRLLDQRQMAVMF